MSITQMVPMIKFLFSWVDNLTLRKNLLMKSQAFLWIIAIALRKWLRCINGSNIDEKRKMVMKLVYGTSTILNGRKKFKIAQTSMTQDMITLKKCPSHLRHTLPKMHKLAVSSCKKNIAEALEQMKPCNLMSNRKILFWLLQKSSFSLTNLATGNRMVKILLLRASLPMEIDKTMMLMSAWVMLE